MEGDAVRRFTSRNPAVVCSQSKKCPGARELGAAGIVKVELGELWKLLENFAESALVFSVNLFAVV